MIGPAGRVIAAWQRAVGGAAQLRAIALLAASLAMAAADQTIAGAVAPELIDRFRISNTDIGLLVTAASVLGAATTLPFGVLADRTHRVRLLAGCVLAWSAAVVAAGAAQSFLMLLGAQIALGAGVGAAGPLVASLAGDLFHPDERGQVYGYILAGEFAGAASGLLIAGEVAAWWSWSGAYWVMAVPGLVLAYLLLHRLPEPVRGATTSHAGTPNRKDAAGLTATVQRAGIAPRPEHVLDSDPTDRPMRWAIRYVLSISSNVAMIAASALLYFYVAGLQTFAIVYMRGRFDVGQGIATVLLVAIGAGVITGTLVTGVLSDRIIGKGMITARPVVAGVCCLLAVVFFVPGFLAAGLALAIPLFFLGAAGIGGANPPIDAARLDIMHSRLWGRAESVRTFLQTLFKAGAPLLFGYLSTLLGDGSASRVQGGGGLGLERTFLLLLAVVVISAVVLLTVARRRYPRDVATAIASERATR